MLLYTERLTANGTDSFSGILFSTRTESKKLVKKHRKDIRITMETAIEAIEVLLWIVKRKLNCPGPSSYFFVSERYLSSCVFWF